MQVEVRSRVPGHTSATTLPNVLVDLGDDGATVRDLIQATVAAQVAATRGDIESGAAMLRRQYLIPEEVKELASGAAPDERTEVGRAVRAFELRVFVVFCNGRQMDGLDDPVRLRDGDPVVFLRLVPMMGGAAPAQRRP